MRSLGQSWPEIAEIETIVDSRAAYLVVQKRDGAGAISRS